MPLNDQTQFNAFIHYTSVFYNIIFLIWTKVISVPINIYHKAYQESTMSDNTTKKNFNHIKTTI